MEFLELARPEDWEDINRIARQVCELHASWGSGQVVERPYPMDYYLECIREKKLYAARRNGTVVGYLLFYFWQAGGPAAARRKMVSIDDIGVEQSLRNQGIGQRMMADLRELAQVEGCSAIQLYVDAPNENAIAFYKKCGLHIANHGMLMNL
ncbi:MAG: GNAT family N-acetyltransferase [Oscillospiraceae bacterium]|nr:GNAT family N-acetyltransferase [Oscillospiraceae bacterium]